MAIVVKLAETEVERQQAFRLRFKIYVEEKHLEQEFADSVAKTIQEPADEDATIIVAMDGDRVVGTLRHQTYPSDFGIYKDLYQMEKYIPFYPRQTSVTTKFVIDEGYRMTSVAFKLALEGCRTGFLNGIRFDFICCYSDTLPLFRKIGYRQFQPEIIHPEFGRVIPLVLACDIGYLNSINSPIYSHLKHLNENWDKDFEGIGKWLLDRGISDKSDIGKQTTSMSIQVDDENGNPIHNKTADELISQLDARIEDHLINVVEKTELCRLISNPETDSRLVRSLIRHTMVESYSFAPELCRITFKAVGQMPFDLPIAMKHACLHVLEEVDHGDMALRTFITLGGDEKWARTRRMTHATYAMISACERLVDQENGVAYLGYMYPLEKMTPVITERAIGWLERHGIGPEYREFIDVHAVADMGHMISIQRLIRQVVPLHPELGDLIKYACDLFLSLYPEPIWDAVLARAYAEIYTDRPA